MIVVRVEVWPHGREGAHREVAQLHIANVGGDLVHGDYVVDSEIYGVHTETRTGGLKRHDRARPILNLVSKALAVLGYA